MGFDLAQTSERCHRACAGCASYNPIDQTHIQTQRGNILPDMQSVSMLLPRLPLRPAVHEQLASRTTTWMQLCKPSMTTRKTGTPLIESGSYCHVLVATRSALVAGLEPSCVRRKSRTTSETFVRDTYSRVVRILSVLLACDHQPLGTALQHTLSQPQQLPQCQLRSCQIQRKAPIHSHGHG